MTASASGTRRLPLGRVVLAELKKSCDKHGIQQALYFSEGEWRHSGGVDDPTTPGPESEYQGGSNPGLKKAQLKERLTQYGPMNISGSTMPSTKSEC